MARSQNSFLKRQLEQKKAKKKEDKKQKKLDRQENSTGGKLANMLAYVDENGNITDTPPEERPAPAASKPAAAARKAE